MKISRQIRRRLGKWLSFLLGLMGGFLLYISLAPVLLSGRNADVIASWRDTILQWTQFTGYLKLAFAVAALIVICIGLLGVIITLFKPTSGQKIMMWGGIASLSLLLTLWLGFLDFHDPLVGSTDIGSRLVWDSNWGIADWAFVRKIFHTFEGGWIRPAFIGGILLLFTGLPSWWSKLR